MADATGTVNQFLGHIFREPFSHQVIDQSILCVGVVVVQYRSQRICNEFQSIAASYGFTVEDLIEELQQRQGADRGN